MICEAYIVAWNEAETIDLTIAHYQQYCEQITILDNYSDDGTRGIAEEMGCIVKSFGVKGVLDDKEYLKVKNECYRLSRAKYVIVCDSDEILWHPNLKEILANDTATIFNTIGWDIFSNEMPQYDYLEIQTGIFSGNYCKKIIFSPKISINYGYGCHTCSPAGRVRPSNKNLTLFHYRNIGGYERLSKRHEQYRKRLSEHNKAFGLGCHYSFPEEQRKKEWYGKQENAIEYADFDPSRHDILAL